MLKLANVQAAMTNGLEVSLIKGIGLEVIKAFGLVVNILKIIYI
jgi:hypothetical protein